MSHIVSINIVIEGAVMHIQLVKVSRDTAFKSYKAFNGGPPQNIFSVAAVTPDSHHLELFDETIGQTFNPKKAGDLVALFAATPDIPRAYMLADQLRAKNIPVVLGGLHVTFLPEEAILHADSVLIGAEEEIWPQMLEDLETGQLQKFYCQKTPLDLRNLAPYRTEFARPYLGEFGVWSVVASRGCKFKCDYCMVHKFFPQFQTRPVGQVLDEIRASGVRYLEIHADNLIADRDYALELFEGLAKLDVQWVGEATLNMAGYPEILEAAAKSGLFYLVVGLETCSAEALKEAGKGFIKPDRAGEQIRALHDYGIVVDSCLLFGFDAHGPQIFEETLHWVEEVELDVAHPTLLTPFPGTALFERLSHEGRIRTRDWSLFDCSHAVFDPAQMSASELEEGVDWFAGKYNGFFRRRRRKAARIRNLGREGASYLP